MRSGWLVMRSNCTRRAYHGFWDRLRGHVCDSAHHHSQRKALSAALNELLASPTFASWLRRAQAVIVSVAHLDAEARARARCVGKEVLSWVRTLPGSQRLRALIAFRRGLRLLAPAPPEPAYQAPAGGVDEAGARLRRPRDRRYPKSDEPRLQSAEQLG